MTVPLATLLSSIYSLSNNSSLTISEIEDLTTYEFNMYTEMTTKKVKTESEVEKAKFKSISGALASMMSVFGGKKR